MSVDGRNLHGLKPRTVVLGSGNTFNLASGTFHAYFTPNGRLSFGDPLIRQLNLGFHGRVIRQMVNLPINNKITPFNFGVRVAGVDSPFLLSIPAGLTGQFDSGLLSSPIEFTDVDQFSVFYDLTAGGIGTLQMERFLTVLEVTSVP